jgi:hypothetical protein
MKKLYIRIKSNLEKVVIGYRESNYDFLRFHLGSNSIFLALVFFICLVITLRADVLNWNYLKGINHELAFFIGFFSILFGVGFYSFWNLGEKSIYTIHFAKTRFLAKGVDVIFEHKGFSFGVSSQIKTRSAELTSVTREIFCVGIFLSMALATLDNGGFERLVKFPSEIMQSNTRYCPTKDESIEEAPPKEGCELIIRAYKLGYAKDLGICEPEKIDPEKMEICEKRREDEPYFYYMTRLLRSSIEKKMEFFDDGRAQQIRDKFDLQLQELEVLKDYQAYAISASPRASHHIWTNLPYPENDFVQKYREVLQPNYCIGKFQNQTNTIRIDEDDERQNSKILEHVYGQLLFNPKSRISVGVCKEYKIHWNAEPDVCERLAINPEAVLLEEEVFSEVELVLRRHDIANVILDLDAKIKDIEKVENKPLVAQTDAGEEKGGAASKNAGKSPAKEPKSKIVTGKIAKDIQQRRKKNELVSFQCFMQENAPGDRSLANTLTLKDTEFVVRTRYFPLIESKGESQISMYRELSRVLEDRFHYSQLTSRSDVNLKGDSGDGPAKGRGLEEPSFLLSRLETLENVDIFLGNSWVLEREDLLGVYPYHVHLQNYVNSFRAEYHESRGRL